MFQHKVWVWDLYYYLLVGNDNSDISYWPLAVSLTTSIMRSMKFDHPTPASGVKAGPRAVVKYSRTTP